MCQVGCRNTETAVGRGTGDAPVLCVGTVNVTAQGLRSGTAQGVWDGKRLAACHSCGNAEGTAQGELYHVDAPGHLSDLHFCAFTDFHTYTHRVGSHAHVFRNIHRIGTSCRYVSG